MSHTIDIFARNAYLDLATSHSEIHRAYAIDRDKDISISPSLDALLLDSTFITQRDAAFEGHVPETMDIKVTRDRKVFVRRPEEREWRDTRFEPSRDVEIIAERTQEAYKRTLPTPPPSPTRPPVEETMQRQISLLQQGQAELTRAIQGLTENMGRMTFSPLRSPTAEDGLSLFREGQACLHQTLDRLTACIERLTEQREIPPPPPIIIPPQPHAELSSDLARERERTQHAEGRLATLQEEHLSLRRQVEDLTARERRATDETSVLRGQVATLSAQQKEGEGARRIAEEQLKISESARATTEADNRHLSSRVSTLTGEAGALRAAIDGQEREISSLRDRVADLTARERGASDTVSALREQLATLTAELSAQRQQTHAAEHRATTEHARASQLGERVITLTGNAEASRVKIEEQQRELSRVQVELAEAKSRAMAAESYATDAIRKAEAFAVELQALREQDERQSEELRQAFARVHQLEAINLGLLEQVTDSTLAQTEAQIALEQAQALLAKKEERIQFLGEKIVELNLDLQKLYQERNQALQERDHHQRRADELWHAGAREIASRDQQIEDLSRRIRALTDLHHFAKKDLEAKETELGFFKGDYQRVTQAIPRDWGKSPEEYLFYLQGIRRHHVALQGVYEEQTREIAALRDALIAT